MNGWILAGLVLVFLAIIASIALWARDKFSQLEAEKAGFKQAADRAEQALEDLVAQRDEAMRLFDGVQPKLDGMAMAIRDQAQRNAQVVTERDALRLQLEEALRPKLPPSDGAVKKPRVPRTRPTSLEPPSQA
jgi:hypothetical protein